MLYQPAESSAAPTLSVGYVTFKTSVTFKHSTFGRTHCAFAHVFHSESGNYLAETLLFCNTPAESSAAVAHSFVVGYLQEERAGGV